MNLNFSYTHIYPEFFPETLIQSATSFLVAASNFKEKYFFNYLILCFLLFFLQPMKKWWLFEAKFLKSS